MLGTLRFTQPVTHLVRTGNRSSQRGQTLVVFAAGIVGFLGMVALVIDGSSYYAQSRAAQKVADAASQAGAAVLARSIAQGIPASDGEVKDAIDEIALANGFPAFFSAPDAPEAYYTDIDGTDLGVIVGGGSIPGCTSDCIGNRAVGVRVRAVHSFGSYIAGIVGQATFTVAPEAVAVAGFVDIPCDAEGGCPLVPVSVARQLAECELGDPVYGPAWPPSALENPAPNDSPTALLRICENDEGDLGLLDYTCANPEPSIQDQVIRPCHGDMAFPLWQQAWDGNPGNLQTKFNRVSGDQRNDYEPDKDRVILLPVFDAVCNDVPANPSASPVPGASGTYPQVCEGNPGSLIDRHYRLVSFVGFILDKAYLGSGHTDDCRGASLRTSTTPTSTGQMRCMKGWFTNTIAPPGTVTVDPGPEDWDRPVSVQLIR
jgi:hypothetical protein